ncbi:MAG: PIN domain-containing protein [Candidatus Acidiferrales bacterium]
MNRTPQKSEARSAAKADVRPKLIVLDANVFIADYWLRSPSFVLLRDFLTKTDAVLIVPKIVAEEAVNHHAEDINRLMAEVRSLNRNSGRLLRSYKGQPPETIVKHNRADSYEDFLLSQLKTLKAKIPEYREIPHSEIVRRDLRRKRPFQESGKGYRDTLLWESIVRQGTEKGALTVFITQNTRDFADSNGDLHSDLMSDIWDKRAEGTELVLCPSLPAFTDTYIVPFLVERKDFAMLVRADKVPGLNLKEATEASDDALTEAVNNSPSVMIGDPGQYEPEVDVIGDICEFDVKHASEISKDTLLIVFEFQATVAFTYFLPRDEYVTMSDDAIRGIAILDANWNEYVMQVESVCTVRFNCRLTFNSRSEEVESFEVESVEAVEDL